jgi:hypothetical protein
MPDSNLPQKTGEVVAAAIDSDSELIAIRDVLSALVPLKSDARSRVVDYVFKRLGLAIDSGTPVFPASPLAFTVDGVDVSGPIATSSSGVQDIRSLAQQKSPKSANEMAALVAYYLADVAPLAVRKDTINADDVRKYFKQALFKLPSSAKMTLINAKNSGYLESSGTAGQYKLNPVGYNLVVHGLPAHSEKERRSNRQRKAKKKASRRSR